MWNERKKDSNFQQAYEKMLCELALSYTEIAFNAIDEIAISNFFTPHQYLCYSFPHSQHFDFDSLKGSLLSSSYTPHENHPNYQRMMQNLTQIFDLFSYQGGVEFEYECKFYLGRIKHYSDEDN